MRGLDRCSKSDRVEVTGVHFYPYDFRRGSILTILNYFIEYFYESCHGSCIPDELAIKNLLPYPHT